MRERMMALLAGAALVAAFGVVTSAQGKSVTGTLVDQACFTKQGAKATADEHAECSASCAKRGSTMVIVTASEVLEITGDYTADKNAKLVEFAGKKVTATGDVAETGGKKTIKVASMKAAE
ncbi:MAG: hypothetical protein U0Q12_04240 [Vicinamibacterales bacterium]